MSHIRQPSLGHRAAVAEHREHVADSGHFLEEMADIDDAHPGRPQIANHGEQMSRVFLGERASRLVEHENLGVRRDRSSDLDQLLLGDRQPADGSVERQIALRKPAEPPVQSAAAQPFSTSRTATALARAGCCLDRQVRREIQLLINHRDAGTEGIDGPRRAYGFPSTMSWPASGR